MAEHRTTLLGAILKDEALGLSGFDASFMQRSGGWSLPKCLQSSQGADFLSRTPRRQPLP